MGFIGRIQSVRSDRQVLVEVAEETASLLNRCPSCKTGELHTVASFDQRGPPANWFNEIRKQNSKRQVA